MSRPALTAALLTLLLVWLSPLAVSQAPAQSLHYGTTGKPLEEGLELLQTEPYDVIYFNEPSGGGWVKALPLALPGRKVPAAPSGTLTFSIVGLEGQRFSAKWGDIERVDLWEEKLQREAAARLQASDFTGAYPFLAILIRDYPEVPGLRELRSEFLFKDSARRFREGEFEPTLAMLEELRRFEPNYQPDRVIGVISAVADRLMQAKLDAGKTDQAQQLLARLRKDYPNDQLPAVKKWDAQFLEMATAKRLEAEAAMGKEDWREARRLAIDSLYLYPEIEGGKELVKEIARRYPMVRVGVLQEATSFDPTRIDNWPSRRAGRLVNRTLFEMRGTGPEGGEYDFVLGQTEQSPDRLQLDLRLTQQKMRPPMDRFTSETLADLIARRAQPGVEGFEPAWAGVLDAVSLRGPQELVCMFRRPHLLPASLLQIRIDSEMLGLPPDTPTGVYAPDTPTGVSTPDTPTGAYAPDTPTGVYAPAATDGAETRFRLTGEPVTETQPREIVEIKMPAASDAVTSLLKGEIDVIDRLFPSDAARLRRSRDVVVANYPLPTVHMLIPCSDHAFIADANFRRALLYGINRQDILSGEFLEGVDTPGCRVISGPFPASIEPNDPLAYAYNEAVVPMQYQPQLANLLIVLATKQLADAAEKKKAPKPELKPIRLATPDDDLSRVACEAIKTQWELIGLKVELVTLPKGETMPKEGQADLAYVVAAVWEPIVDARRVLGPEGLAKSADQFVGLGLRDVEAATNWREARERLQELHRTASSELPIIPLWQLVDAFAYRREVTGVGQEIVSLYQNVERWRLNIQ
jgi:tetratricopeptide (TPR) repeat protein